MYEKKGTDLYLTHGPAELKLEDPQQGRTGADGRPLPSAHKLAQGREISGFR